MTFFYDLNKKLDSIREKPEVTHKQLNERDEGKPGKNFAKIAKDAGERYGSEAAGKRVAGAVRNKLRDQGKLEEEQVDEVVRAGTLTPTGGGETVLTRPSNQAGRDALAKQIKNVRADPMNPAKRGGTSGKTSDTIYTAKQFDNTRDWAATPKARDGKGIASGPTMAEAGVMDTVKSVGKKVASGINRLVGHGSDEDMRKDLQRKSGAPVTGKKPSVASMHPSDEYDYFTRRDKVRGGEQQVKEKMSPAKQKSFAALAPPADKITFADKIAGAKKEVDEMLGDVAAEAMRSALGGGKGRNAAMEEGGPAIDTTGYSPEMQERIKNSTPQELSQMAHELAGDPSRYSYEYKNLEAVRSLLRGTTKYESKGRNPNAEMDEDNAFDYKSPRKDAPRVGSVERGHKHDIKHTATGRVVTRRTDDQGNSVGADDESDAQAAPRGRGRPKGTKGAIGAKGPSGRSKLMTKEGVDQGQAQQVVDDLAELRAIAKQSQRGGEFPQGFASQLEVVLYAAITLIKNQQPGDAQVREEEKTSTRDDHAEKAGKKVTKDIEYDEKKKDGIHGKKRGAEDAKAEKAGKKVAKDIEYDEKKKDKEVDESTTSGSVATSTATKGGGSMVGKGIYDSMNRELENMIAESMSINMSDSTEGNKSLSVTATDEDALKLGMLLKSAGLGGGDSHGGDMHSHGEEPCDTCGMQDCGCGDVQEAVDENSPDWPTNTETSNNAMQYAGGLNKPKTDVAGDGQTTIPNTAVHTQDEDALRRMMEMAGIKQAELEPWKETMKEDAEEDATDAENAVNDAEAAKDEIQEDFAESIQRMREIAGIREAKKDVEEEKTEEGNLFTGNLAKARADGKKQADLDGDGDMEKVRESIFALNNQWRAYKG